MPRGRASRSSTVTKRPRAKRRGGSIRPAKRALAIGADVTDPASLAEAAAAAARLGALSGWVNNAGIVQMIAASDLTR